MKSITLSGSPRMVLPNKACDTLAVANQNKGELLEQGSITIVRGFDTDQHNTTSISLDSNKQWDDNFFLQRGLHMPLTKNALKYWDSVSHIAEDEDFSTVIENYRSSIFLEPKKLAWGGPDETELLVNMQENNGVLRINVTENAPVAVASYGLKDHSVIPVDINENDKDCVLKTYRDLFALRSPDAISTISYNGKLYLITANEGDAKKYGEEFEDERRGKNMFDGDEFGLDNVLVDKEIFDPDNITAGTSALFNDKCKGDDCVERVKLSVGSSAIDFEMDWENPTFYRMVLTGGRGWTIYEIPQDPDSLLRLVFDSAASLEGAGCQLFPWSHNAQHDEEDAPLVGPNNTLIQWAADDEKLIEDIEDKNDPEEDGCEDQGNGTPGVCPLSKRVDEESASEGPGVEEIAVGVACGRLLTVTATEKASVGYVFDITDITSPSLVNAFHLSPASETMSPGLAYNAGLLGEVDPESIIFLAASESPSGNAGILFTGTWSGTVSFWEFECAEPDVVEQLAKESSSSPRITLGLVSTAAWLTFFWIALVALF